MREYHKIQTVLKRDPENNHKTLLEGQFSREEFEYLADKLWVFTEKVDGTNIRVMWNKDTVSFAGKTDNASIHPKLVDHLKEVFTPLRMANAFSEADVCLYGEGYGPKIQSGGKYRSDQSFVLFDIWIDGWWLRRSDVVDVSQTLEVDVVPIIGMADLWEMVDRAKEGFQSKWGDFQAEGIVARPPVELFARNGDRIITKIKCKDFQ